MKFRRFIAFFISVCLALAVPPSVHAKAKPKAFNGKTCTLVGTSKSDKLKGTSKADVICGLGGNDTISGGAGNDTIDGGAGNDTLKGNSGNDNMQGGTGADVFSGGTGSDTVNFSEKKSNLILDIDDKADDGVTGEKDNIKSDVENVIGGSGNDMIAGNSSPNNISGGSGDDGINGGSGNDVLNGQIGNDDLFGGPGIDVTSGGSGLNTCEIGSNEIRDVTCQLIHDMSHLFERVHGNLAFDGKNYLSGAIISSYTDSTLNERIASGVIAPDGSFMFDTTKNATSFYVTTSDEKLSLNLGNFSKSEITQPIVFLMPKLNTTTLQVTNSRGESLPGVNVSVRFGWQTSNSYRDSSLGYVLGAKTDAKGQVKFLRPQSGLGLSSLSASLKVAGTTLRMSNRISHREVLVNNTTYLVFDH